MRLVYVVLFILLFLFNVNKSAFAVSVTVSEVPASIGNEPFEVRVSVSGAQTGTNYLRVNFSRINETNYFGFTYNGTGYYNGSDHLQYFPVTIDTSGNWEGIVKGKIDPDSSFFKGPGDYNLKVRRYTDSGSYIWSNEVLTNIDYSNPSPSPSPSISPTPIITPTPTPTSITLNTVFVAEDVPAQISTDEVMKAHVKLIFPNSPNTNFFIKGAFLKTGESNYFGLTKVGESYIKNSASFSSQKQITTNSSGEWEGEVEIKVDIEDSGFKGDGDYIFKAARYTNAGNGPYWSNGVTVVIKKTEVREYSQSSPKETSPSARVDTSDFGESIIDRDIPADLFAKSSINTQNVAGVSTGSSEIMSKTKGSLISNLFYIIAGVFIIILGIVLMIFRLQKKGIKNVF